MEYQRNGFLLTRHSILKQEYRGQNAKHIDLNQDGQHIESIKYECQTFMKFENVIIVSQPTEEGMRNIIKDNSNVIWLNLREEPTVFINGISYVLRDSKSPLRNIDYFKGMNAVNIEQHEKRLKEEILNEYKINNKLKEAINDEKLQMKEQCIEVIGIKTCLETVDSLNVLYKRVPISSFGSGYENNTIDILSNIFGAFEDSNTVVLCSGRNGMRASYCYILYLLYKNYDKGKFSTVKNKQVEKDNKMKANEFAHDIINIFKLESNKTPLLQILLMGKYKIVVNLSNLLEAKSQIPTITAYIYKLDRKINFLLLMVEKYLNNNIKNKYKEEYILILLTRYITIIIYGEYLLQKDKTEKELTFNDFILKSYEFMNLYNYLNKKKPISSLLSPLDKIIDNDYDINDVLSNNIYAILLKDKTRHNLGNLKSKTLIKKNDENQNIIFINLREEPVIYIDEEEYILRDIEKFDKNITFLRMLNKQKLSRIEQSLKLKLIAEYKSINKIVYYIIKDNEIVKYYKSSIQTDAIKTQDEYFTVFNFKKYIRVPITSSVSFRFKLFDKIIKVVDNLKLQNRENVELVIHSHTSKGRSAYFKIILDLITNSYVEKHSTTSKLHIEPILLLVNFLECGVVAKKKVEYLFIKHFNSTFLRFLNHEKHFKKIQRSIKKYFLLICFASYLMSKKELYTFEDWMLNRKEIIYLYRQINSLNFDDVIRNTTEDYYEHKNNLDAIVGESMMLKYDYFVGSKFFNLYDHIKGTRNLRHVDFHSGLILGLANPTEKGIANVVLLIKNLWQNKNVDVNWICLREEPVIFINGLPYVLRNKSRCNENLEITGISTESIELIEEKLKNNILKQSTIILYDEVYNYEKIETRKTNVKIKSVLTLKDLFSSTAINFHRIPVTDEKIPIPEVIDRIYKICSGIQNDKIVVFNCQMGKGRTTTGMVIAYLIYNHDIISSEKKIQPKYILISKLLQLLPMAHKSKLILDTVIDKFEHLENLREVISTCDMLGQKIKAKNFQLRYFFLICFSEFLLQKSDSSFSNFLSKRPEIKNLADKIEEIGFEKFYG